MNRLRVLGSKTESLDRMPLLQCQYFASRLSLCNIKVENIFYG